MTKMKLLMITFSNKTLGTQGYYFCQESKRLDLIVENNLMLNLSPSNWESNMVEQDILLEKPS